MEYITVANGIITGHFCGETLPDGAIQVPDGFPGWEGLPVDAITADYSAIKPLSQQVFEGVVSIPDGYKINKEDNEFIRMNQDEIDALFPPEVWAVPESFDAVVVKRTFDRYGNFGYFAPENTIKMNGEQPTAYHKAESNGKWTPDVDRARAIKLEEVNATYNDATSALVATYPQTEILTFDKQEKEARSWGADNAAETPFLDGLALARGIDKAELVRRVIAKSDAFQAAVATLTGLRQRYEDQLSMATTAEEVAAIVPVYNI